MEVRGKQFRMTPIPYTQMRPFSFLEITLKDVRGLADTDPKIEEKIKSYLTAKVNEMIASTRLEADRVSSSLPELIFRVKDPNLVVTDNTILLSGDNLRELRQANKASFIQLNLTTSPVSTEISKIPNNKFNSYPVYVIIIDKQSSGLLVKESSDSLLFTDLPNVLENLFI